MYSIYTILKSNNKNTIINILNKHKNNKIFLYLLSYCTYKDQHRYFYIPKTIWYHNNIKNKWASIDAIYELLRVFEETPHKVLHIFKEFIENYKTTQIRFLILFFRGELSIPVWKYKIFQKYIKPQPLFTPFKMFKKTIHFPLSVVVIPNGIRTIVKFNSTGKAKIYLEGFPQKYLMGMEKHLTTKARKINLINAQIEGIIEYKNIHKLFKQNIIKSKNFDIIVYQFFYKYEIDFYKIPNFKVQSRLPTIINSIGSNHLNALSYIIAQNEKELKNILQYKRYFKHNYSTIITELNSTYNKKGFMYIRYNSLEYILQIKKIRGRTITASTSDGLYSTIIKKGLTDKILKTLKNLQKDYKTVKVVIEKNKTIAITGYGIPTIFVDTVDTMERKKMKGI